MKILKRIGSIVLDILIVIVFIVSTLVVIATVTAKRENGQANVFGYTINSVQTESMKGSIDAGDLVISKVITDANRKDVVLKEGDIVSFYQDFDKNQKILITHRIINIRDAAGTKIYTTQGDNREISTAPDAPMTIHEIEMVYVFKIPFLGNFIDFLKTPLGFIICLVLPLLAFIAFQAYKLITLYLRAKKLELVEEANNIANSAKIENNSNNENNSKPELSEEEKNAIIAEYLAKQALEKEKAEKASADDDKTDVAEEDPETERESEVEAELEVEESTEAEEENEAEESDEKN